MENHPPESGRHVVDFFCAIETRQINPGGDGFTFKLDPYHRSQMGLRQGGEIDASTPLKNCVDKTFQACNAAVS
ncbi:hypothetical protein [Burkholderia cepacia]|uniref:hypothetical protein n=1 Tax=Burkholderia cepacia TaxID=292 RepID=UPI0012D9779A|nr:hypothetical protein [Burkholderia cepacia]